MHSSALPHRPVGNAAPPRALRRSSTPARRCAALRPAAALAVAADAATAAAAAAAVDPVGIYAVLAVVGSLFAATFFVAPRFSSLFKEEYPWEAMYPELVAQGVVVVAPGEAARGSTAWFRPLRLLDVRADGSRPLLPGAVALSLYRPIKEFDFASNIRRAAFAFFAVPGTEGDPEWLGAVERALPDKGAPVVCACERGGRLSNRAGEKLGSQSRSLKAVFLLRQAGYTDVRLLDGGVYEWRRAGLPVVEEEGDDE